LSETPGLDILMLQDGIGVNHATIAESVEYFKALSVVCKSTGHVQLWSDVEIFTMSGSSFSSAPISRIVSQLDAESQYVDNLVCFEFHSYMSPSTNNLSLSLYENYDRYRQGLSYPLSFGSFMKNYTLSQKPSPEYPDTPFKLTNGKADFLWADQVGWNGVSLVSVLIDLQGTASGIVDFRGFFMHSEDSGVYPPGKVVVGISNDGQHFTDVGTLVPFNLSNESENIYRLSVVTPVSGKFVQFTFTSAGPWVMCTELEIYVAT